MGLNVELMCLMVKKTNNVVETVTILLLAIVFTDHLLILKKFEVK